MTDTETAFQLPPHDHMFLGRDHDRAERRTWAVIILCSVMMIVEIIGGALFGSLALIADGLHMSTHAGALLLAALAYTYARKYANDRNFTFGTGKFGDLAGYSSAIVLAMIALLIGYEAVSRLFNPVAISFNEAIPIAVLGLVVNVASAWLLSGGHHHNHGHDHDHDHGKKPARIDSSTDALDVELEEHDHDAGHGAHHRSASLAARAGPPRRHCLGRNLRGARGGALPHEIGPIRGLVACHRRSAAFSRAKRLTQPAGSVLHPRH